MKLHPFGVDVHTSKISDVVARNLIYAKDKLSGRKKRLVTETSESSALVDSGSEEMGSQQQNED